MKPLKDIDSIHQTLILKTLCVIFPLVSFLGWVHYGLVGILYAGIICAIATFLSVFIAGITGGTVSKLWGGKTPIWTQAERFAADFSRARYQKMNKNYNEALRIIDQVLEEQPDYNEALFLKARIMAEGFNDRYEARKLLIQGMKSEPQGTDVCGWSRQLYKDLETSSNG